MSAFAANGRKSIFNAVLLQAARAEELDLLSLLQVFPQHHETADGDLPILQIWQRERRNLKPVLILFNAARALNQTVKQASDLYHLISTAMSNVTACLRFPGQVNADLRKMMDTMVPTPRLHFFKPSLAHLQSSDSRESMTLSIPELTQQMFDAKNMMVACNPSQGRYLAVTAVFRGGISLKEVEKHVLSSTKGIPRNVKTNVYDIAPHGYKMTGTVVGNNTAIVNLLQRLSDNFQRIYKHKTLLHLYKTNSMNEMELERAYSDVQSLISEYHHHHHHQQQQQQ
ncbi:tubulin beta chain [Plakobranchus ocellatus]|uniref:Tubulin beta chain n=1 Tax=Plakobranchus ocellatus TaxID=259542 RepID=A0AAV4AI70_9GAST|nr:tubulin beta chain [Plakobranchus ocellatus]